ncbi:hypothetical protein [Nonomuraea sp. NPDC050786]|uniref:hypothetical protein n=1 Tax=Nonomuraea sp. NPDC050786 TaxID=3154840 RepID=UPI0033C5B82D
MSLDDATAQLLQQMGEAGGKPPHEMTPEGQMHAFFTMVNVLPGSAAAIDMVVKAIDGSLR